MAGHHGAGKMGMMGDMQAMCERHKEMMAKMSPEEHKAMMAQHMGNMSPEMMDKHMAMMDAKCR